MCSYILHNISIRMGFGVIKYCNIVVAHVLARILFFLSFWLCLRHCNFSRDNCLNTLMCSKLFRLFFSTIFAYLLYVCAFLALFIRKGSKAKDMK